MSHYFTTPTGPEKRRRITVRFWDTDWEFTTASGVFSADGLDPGHGVVHVPRVLGRRVRLDGDAYTVVGVAPAALDRVTRGAALFVPLALDPSQRRNFTPYLSLLGRLAPDASERLAFRYPELRITYRPEGPLPATSL